MSSSILFDDMVSDDPSFPVLIAFSLTASSISSSTVESCFAWIENPNSASGPSSFFSNPRMSLNALKSTDVSLSRRLASVSLYTSNRSQFFIFPSLTDSKVRSPASITVPGASKLSRFPRPLNLLRMWIS